MPTLDLILLPLLGGYIFLSSFNYFKYYHQRVESQRLLLNSMIAGIFITVVAIMFDYFYLKPIPSLRNFLSGLIPIRHKGLNLSILVFAISYPIAFILNWIYDENSQLDKVIKKWGDDYEKLFWSSMKETEDRKKFIMITNENDKVYVGYISTISQPIGNTYIKLIPYFSGYRDTLTRELIITTDYFEALENLLNRDDKKEIDARLGIILPKDKITIVSKFDFEVFGRFNSPEPEA